MARVGQIRRRDNNEKSIVDALLEVGALVIRVSEKGAPDLVVTYRGKVFLLEVKAAKAPGQAAGRTTIAQDARSAEGWPVTITRTEYDALQAIGAISPGSVR